MQLDDGDLLLSEGWINGKVTASDKRFAVTDPATLDTVANVSDLDATHAADAIAAATAAFASWRQVPTGDRVARVLAWAEQIESDAADLATIITQESGKPLAQARGEAAQCAALLRWFAEQAGRQQGLTLPKHDPGQQNYTIKQPVGVVACITPWNFPAAAVIVKAGAAIVSGCTSIVKPSEETPLIALALARLADRAGIPSGVLNVLPCENPAAIGEALCNSEDVRMLSFTGSIPVGKKLYAACGNTVKRLALELGGNAPFIVFDDADIERALEGALGARFYNSGQICVGANRFFIQDTIYKDFAESFAKRVRSLKVGNGFDASSDIGPMINRAAIERLKKVVASATGMGAKVLAGGGQDDESSLYFQATVIADMTPAMPAYATEIFGPIACLYPFAGEDEVLQLANDTQAGLSAYVYSSDRNRLDRFTASLEAGVVGANSANIFANDLPFGGIKQSGLGREHGAQCLDEYVETKSICMGL